MANSRSSSVAGSRLFWEKTELRLRPLSSRSSAIFADIDAIMRCRNRQATSMKRLIKARSRKPPLKNSAVTGCLFSPIIKLPYPPLEALMFRRFEARRSIQHYDDLNPPPDTWRYLKRNLRPFRFVMAMSSLLTIIGAAIKIWLISLYRKISSSSILAAARPEQLSGIRHRNCSARACPCADRTAARQRLSQGKASMTSRFGRMPKTLFRWRAHRHVLRQSVGWFRKDFPGRIANSGARHRQFRDRGRPMRYCTRYPSSRSMLPDRSGP